MVNGTTDISHDWFESAFDALYPVVYAHRTVEAARPECVFAAEHLRLQGKDRVLDLCCGNGRHLVHLLSYTRRCHGADFSRALLRIAGETTQRRALLTRADMRRLPFHECFDVVVNFFTSFGYFLDDDENEAAARALGRALKPGGRFMIDFLNPPYVEETLIPESDKTQGEYRIREKRWIDEQLRRVNKSTVIEQHGIRVSMANESVRLYSLAELEAMLGRHGLDILTVHGNYQGEPLTFRQPRMILIGRKRA